MTADDQDVRAFLVDAGIANAHESIELKPLTGGVSSDIWRVETGSRTLCLKRALPQLRVQREWLAPITRSSYEWAWLTAVSKLLPQCTPALYAHDASEGLIAMEYLPPERWANWKIQLRDGIVLTETAAQVGDRLGVIHATTADRPDIAAAFASDDIFYALRLKPYLVDTAKAHPDLAGEIMQLVQTTAQTKRVLVHGDVSPKNILIGVSGPLFLDAECAWFGDPAFDLAFVLNHLVLKCVWRPEHASSYLAAFRALTKAYLPHVAWEKSDALEARCARLLPALLLARIDGTSPVEYITDEDEREYVRTLARRLLADRSQKLNSVTDAIMSKAS